MTTQPLQPGRMSTSDAFAGGDARERWLPLIIGLLIAIVIHAIMFSSVAAKSWNWWTTLTESSAADERAAEEARRRAEANKKAQANTPHASKSATPADPRTQAKPKPKPVVRGVAPIPEEDDVRVGRDKGDPLSIAWIGYDDYQELIAPKGQVLQPALQRDAEPVPGAPIRPDPTPPRPAVNVPAVAGGATPMPPVAAVTTPPPTPESPLRPDHPNPVAKPTPTPSDVPKPVPVVAATPPPAPPPAIASAPKPVNPLPVATPTPPPAPAPAAPKSDIAVKAPAPSTGRETLVATPAPAAPKSPDSNPARPLQRPASSNDPTPTLTPPPKLTDLAMVTPKPADPLTLIKPEEILKPNSDGRGKPTDKPGDSKATESSKGSPTTQPSEGSKMSTEAAPPRDESAKPGEATPAPPPSVASAAKPNQASTPGRSGIDGAKDNGDPGKPTGAPRDDRESPPVSLTGDGVVTVRPGRVVAGEGVEIKTSVPRFDVIALASSMPRNPTVVVTFNKAGEVVEAKIIKTSGYPNIDGPILASLYKWKAHGEKLRELNRSFNMTVNILLGEE